MQLRGNSPLFFSRQLAAIQLLIIVLNLNTIHIIKAVFNLDSPDKCLILEPEDWHEMYNFSPDATLLVLGSPAFDPSDYIYDPYESLKILSAPFDTQLKDKFTQFLKVAGIFSERKSPILRRNLQHGITQSMPLV